MTGVYLENVEAILSDSMTVKEIRHIEAEVLNRLLSARVNFQCQEMALQLIHEKLAALGAEPLIYDKPG